MQKNISPLSKKVEKFRAQFIDPFPDIFDSFSIDLESFWLNSEQELSTDFVGFLDKEVDHDKLINSGLLEKLFDYYLTTDEFWAALNIARNIYKGDQKQSLLEKLFFAYKDVILSDGGFLYALYALSEMENDKYAPGLDYLIKNTTDVSDLIREAGTFNDKKMVTHLLSLFVSSGDMDHAYEAVEHLNRNFTEEEFLQLLEKQEFLPEDTSQRTNSQYTNYDKHFDVGLLIDFCEKCLSKDNARKWISVIFEKTKEDPSDYGY